MDFQDILNATRSQMQKQDIDLLLAFHDDGHFIEKPNAVMVLSGFKSIGHAMVIVPRDDRAALIVAPSWDAERAAECAPTMEVIGADDIILRLRLILSGVTFPPHVWAPPVWQACRGVSKSVIQIAKAGTTCGKLFDLVEKEIKPYRPHPMTAGNVGNSIGCFLEEAPLVSAASNDQLESDGVYTLRVGASDGGEQHGIASAMIWVQPQDSTALWWSSG